MKRHSQGNALLIAIIVLTVAAILVGTVMEVTATVARNTNESRNRVTVQAAAEGMLEYAYAVWLKRTQNNHGQLTTSAQLDMTGTGTGKGPSFPGIIYTGTANTPGSGALKVQALNLYGVPVTTGTTPDGVVGAVPGYPGWWGTTYAYGATVGMKRQGDEDSQGVRVRRMFLYTTVSPFQAMFFFQHDLEIYNPAPIVLTGKIHSNGALYLSVSSPSSNLKIMDPTSTAGSLPASGYSPAFTPYVAGVPGFTDQEPPFARGSNYDQGELLPPTWKNNTTNPGSQLNQVAPMDPMGDNLPATFNTSTYSSNPNVVDLNDSLATRTSGTYSNYPELIQPADPSYTEPSDLGKRRFMNKTSLIIRVSGTSRSGTYNSTTKIKPYTTANIGIVSTTVTPFLDTPTDSTKGTVSLNIPAALASYPVLVAANSTIGTTLPVYDTTKTPATQSAAYNNAVTDLVNVLNKQLATDGTSGATLPPALYDQRVGAYVNVVNLNIGALNTFIDENMTGSFNGGLYIYDATASGTTSNTVRLVNGNILPGQILRSNGQIGTTGSANSLVLTPGLTVASQNPVYIKGDYNTGFKTPSSATGSISAATGGDSTKCTGFFAASGSGSSTAYTRQPSAVMGDAIMLLSNAWNDSVSKTYASRTASNTTFNTALLGGYMPSKSGKFSGGAVNYPRFLENWSNKYCTYWGSMVELFPSKVFTQLWQTPGTYYSPPTRYFNFDPNFQSVSPPVSVDAVILSRGAWTKY